MDAGGYDHTIRYHTAPVHGMGEAGVAAQLEDLLEEVPGEPLEDGGQQEVVEAGGAGAG